MISGRAELNDHTSLAKSCFCAFIEPSYHEPTTSVSFTCQQQLILILLGNFIHSEAQ